MINNSQRKVANIFPTSKKCSSHAALGILVLTSQSKIGFASATKMAVVVDAPSSTTTEMSMLPFLCGKRSMIWTFFMEPNDGQC